MTTLTVLYQQQLTAQHLQPDPAQLAALGALDRLAAELAAWQPAPRRRFWQKAPPPPPEGVYLWGPVGRGKSMLLGMFMEAAPLEKKRRVHFHAFMLEVHQRIHDWRQHHAGDPVEAVARAIAAETTLLGFDEFQVTDIADAMILGRLFTALFAAGVVVVATSNTAPENLYEGGLQRSLFLPFIALLRQQVETVAVDGALDYRRRRLPDEPSYHVGTVAPLARDFATLTDKAEGAPLTLEVGGRPLTVPKAAHGVAWFTFDQLCRAPLAAADFEALARHFSTLLLEGIPVIPPDEKNTARRFVILIDTLYEHRTKLIASAAVAPEWVYPAGELVGEFERTVSRLYEMQSRAYWDQPLKSSSEPEHSR